MGLNALQCNHLQVFFFLMQIAQSLRPDTELHKSMVCTIFTKLTSAVQNGKVRLQAKIVKPTSLVSF